MKKFVIGAASAVAILGLSACGDTDDTTTQGLPEQEQMQQEPTTPPAAAPATPAEPAPAN